MSLFDIGREATEWMYKAYNAAGYHLQAMMERKGGVSLDSFYWIRSTPTIPSLADLIFGYKDKIFAVAIVKTRIIDGHREITPDEDRSIARLEKVCKDNELTACLMPINQDLSLLLNDGWGLMNTGFLTRGEKLMEIEPDRMAEDRDVEMSTWELTDFANIAVKKEISAHEGWEVITSQELEGVDPQILFKDQDGNICYVVVRYNVYPQPISSLPGNMIDIHRKVAGRFGEATKGYFATISVKSPEADGKLYRRGGILVTAVEMKELKISSVRPDDGKHA